MKKYNYGNVGLIPNTSQKVNMLCLKRDYYFRNEVKEQMLCCKDEEKVQLQLFSDQYIILHSCINATNITARNISDSEQSDERIQQAGI